MTSRLDRFKTSRSRSFGSVIKNQSGFSLIELMVTVAIVSILSTIAIPNYQLMASRARQTEAKNALSSIYVAEKSYYAEYSTYTYCLYQAGYIPEGARRFYLTGYLTSSMTAVDSTDQGSGTACFFGLMSWAGSERNDGRFDMNSWANSTLIGSVTPGEYSITATGDAFNAVAMGSISSAAIFDVWQITQDNVLTNVQIGY